ncbi:hypothetical protein [Dendronalium sp. ChiSLP03b]|uniref:hypothetical protein n=1 Tax=Dendronalium sp. ChiSLP03b TaxID=3075381 RepID=UPI00391CC4DB
MRENFNKAASVLLSHRLNNLLRIDENIEIDMSYITCAEYQLFINEKSGSEEYLHPEHWNNYRFPNGDAKKSVTGVRAIHAEEFCEWLTQREPSLLYKYRLPNLDEVQKYPLEENDFGYWCQDGDVRIIKGINQIKYQVWAKTLSEIFHNNLKDVYDMDILFGTNTTTFAAKIQVFAKSLQHPDIHEFVRKIYSLSNHQLENINLVKTLRELEKLHNLKDVLNINNSKFIFKSFANYNKQALLKTLNIILENTITEFNFKENNFKTEVKLILTDLQLFEYSMKEMKSSLMIDMKDVYNSIIFGREKIELINPITGRDESIYIPVMHHETTLLANFKNPKRFQESIASFKKDLQDLQKQILEKRSNFTYINNVFEREKELYNESLSKIPKALKIIDSLEENYFHLLIICAICIWIEKVKLAEDILELYLYSILLKERREGRIPAWEGIRIVRERF